MLKVKKMIEEKFDAKAQWCNMHLNDKKAKIANNMIIYEYTNIL